MHETGAIEATGHKVIAVEGADGKVTPQDIRSAVAYHEDEHMVKPKLVYITNATEYGTIYKKQELIDIYNVCKKNDLYLYIDGARLGVALTANNNDITLEDDTKDNGSIFFDVLTDKELLALYFFVEESDPDIVIPEGTYYIDDTQNYWTVNASDGTIGTYYPSFYATHNGIDFTSMYFFVSGIIEVKNKNGKLYMEINALNSYDVPAHIIYDGSVTTDVENIINADTIVSEKRLINDQLIIIRNGNKYNIMGALIK